MRKFLVALVVIILLLAAGGAFVANELRQRVQEPCKGAGEEQFVEIPQGASSPEIRRRLLDARVVSDDFVLRAALWWSGRSRSLQAGEYASISR